ncbi:MAG: hypothetical protein M3446_06720 [Actinomycetota bacterium]|nr:hypothetical protein [Actinomycetota bacterium]
MLVLLSAAGVAACGSTDEEIELGAVGVEAGWAPSRCAISSWTTHPPVGTKPVPRHV